MQALRRPLRYLPVATVVALGIGLSITLFLLVRSAERRQLEVEFEQRADELASSIWQNIRTTVGVLYGVRAFFEASTEVTRQEFAHFVHGPLARTPAIQAVSWDPVVRRVERAAYEAAARREVSRTFAFTERDAGGRMVAAAERSQYVPVYYIEPLTGNEAALGFDLASDLIRRAALERARDTGTPAATPRIRLVQELGEQFGFLILMPVYRRGLPLETAEQRRQALRGYLSGVFRIGSMVDASLRGTDTEGVELEVNDETAPPEERRLHVRRSGTSVLESDVRWLTTLDVGGRQWSLLFVATPTYLAARRSWQPWSLLVGGLLVTGLLAGYLIVWARRTDELLQMNLLKEREIAERRRAEEIAEQRRREAEALADVGLRISQSLDPRDVAQRIADSLRALLATSNAAVWRLVPGSGDLVALAVSGDLGPTSGADLVFPAGTSALGLAVREGRAVTTLNVLEDPRIVLTPEVRLRVERAGYRAVLAVPLRIQDTIIGALGVGDRAGRAFTPAEIELAQAFADQAAIALENARLYEQVRQAYDELSQTQAQFLQAQKMEAVGRLAAGVAHDFNNMLTVIAGRAQLLKRRGPLGEAERRDLELIEGASKRAAVLTKQLLAFSRKQTLQPEIVDLNRVVVNISTLLERLIEARIELSVVPGTDLGRVKADPGQLGQVLMNLSVNARDAMPEGGQLTIETANGDLDRPRPGQPADVPPGRYVTLAVRDTGCGMDPETITRIFEPFFTTKPAEQGTGLGLSTVYGIVTQSGGHIQVESTPGRGTTFTISLPRVEEEVAPSETSQEPRRGAETILLAEDDDPVRETAREILQTRGYTVLEATDGADALRIAQQHPGPIHLLLTDIAMPQLDGPELAERLGGIRPDTRILYMSATFAHADLVGRGILRPEAPFLEKPFNPETLTRQVRQALDTQV